MLSQRVSSSSITLNRCYLLVDHHLKLRRKHTYLGLGGCRKHGPSDDQALRGPASRRSYHNHAKLEHESEKFQSPRKVQIGVTFTRVSSPPLRKISCDLPHDARLLAPRSSQQAPTQKPPAADRSDMVAKQSKTTAKVHRAKPKVRILGSSVNEPINHKKKAIIVDGANILYQGGPGHKLQNWWGPGKPFPDRGAGWHALHTALKEAMTKYGRPKDQIVLVREGGKRESSNGQGYQPNQFDQVRTVYSEDKGDEVVITEARAALEQGFEVIVVTMDKQLKAQAAHNKCSVEPGKGNSPIKDFNFSRIGPRKDNLLQQAVLRLYSPTTERYYRPGDDQELKYTYTYPISSLEAYSIPNLAFKLQAFFQREERRERSMACPEHVPYRTLLGLSSDR